MPKGDLPLPVGEVEAFIRDWSRQGTPARQPQPRIPPPVRAGLSGGQGGVPGLFPPLRPHRRTVEGRGAVNVAIDGMSGSGKSSLAALLQQIYDCNVFHMDDFFLPQAYEDSPAPEPTRRQCAPRALPPGSAGAPEHGTPLCYRPFDCRSQSLGDAVCIEPKQLNIVEGAYCLHPALADATSSGCSCRSAPNTKGPHPATERTGNVPTLFGRMGTPGKHVFPGIQN